MPRPSATTPVPRCRACAVELTKTRNLRRPLVCASCRYGCVPSGPDYWSGLADILDACGYADDAARCRRNAKAAARGAVRLAELDDAS